MNLFAFVENLQFSLIKTKQADCNFISFVIFTGVHNGELFCSCKPTFIGLKIWCGLDRTGVILVLSKASIFL